MNPGNSTNDQLFVDFRVVRGISSTANSAEIGIWNLSESTRNSVGKEFDDIILEAGYANNVGVIFRGQIRDVEHIVYENGVRTAIYAGDGDAAFRSATVSVTVEPGATAEDVVGAVYETFEREGVTRGEWEFPKDMRTYRRPYSMVGPSAREMDTLGRTNKFYWNIQNNAMEILPADGFLPGAVFLSEYSGLVGSPTITDNGVKVRATMNPGIRPNRTIVVDAKTLKLNAISGTYRVGNAEYYGDNRDGPFFIDIQGESVQGGKTVDEGIPVRRAIPV